MKIMKSSIFQGYHFEISRSPQLEMTTAMQIFLPSIPAFIRTYLGETGDFLIFLKCRNTKKK
jgi:hypothetical protein